MSRVVWSVLVVMVLARITVSDVHLWASAFDLMHFVFFALLARQVFCLSGFVSRLAWRTVFAFVCVVFLAGIVEWLQPWVGQERDLNDVWSGVAGGAVALLIVFSRRQPKPLPRAVLIACGALLSVIALWGPASVLMARLVSALRFPVIASFESSPSLGLWEAHGCTINRSKLYATHGHHSLEVVINNETSYPGISLAVWPRNWMRYKVLCLDLVMASDAPRMLWIRLDDKPSPEYSDRFQRSMTLNSGFNRLCVGIDEDLRTPEGRRIDLAQLNYLTIFLGDAKAGDVFHVDHIRLE